MPVTINGTTGIAGVDGSAGTPAVQGSDANTGIYFPAADTVAIAAGGTEAFRATSGGNLSLTGTMAMGSSFLRNRVINGAMVIDQRNSGAAITVNAGSTQYFPIDRWSCSGQTADGVYTAQQVSDAPTGFKNSLKITVTTADASIGATQTYLVSHRIEGYNVADWGLGVSTAQSFTLSFWVKSSVTGTFGLSFGNNVDLSNPFNYSINSANTWEYKTVTFTSPASGTWLTTNGLGLIVVWSLGVGSSLKATAGTWANYPYAPTGSVDLISTLNATWQITGVQLEAGSVATPFERRLYGQELALCQRYYEVGGPYNIWSGDSTSGSTYYHSARYAVTKRSTPNVVTVDGGNARFAAGAPAAVAGYTDILQAYKTANGTGGSAYFAYSWTSSAEL